MSEYDAGWKAALETVRMSLFSFPSTNIDKEISKHILRICEEYHIKKLRKKCENMMTKEEN